MLIFLWLSHAYNGYIISGTFPLVFKLDDNKQIHKKTGDSKILIIRHPVHYQTILRQTFQISYCFFRKH